MRIAQQNGTVDGACLMSGGGVWCARPRQAGWLPCWWRSTTTTTTTSSAPASARRLGNFVGVVRIVTAVGSYSATLSKGAEIAAV